MKIFNWALIATLASSPICLAEDAPLPVEFIKTTSETISVYEFAEGSSFAKQRSYLAFETSGKVGFIAAGESGSSLREGDPVHGVSESEPKGQLLASLRLDSAKADIRTAEAELESAQTMVKVNQREFERAKRLKEANAIEARRYESIEATWQQSQAELKAANARLDQSRVSLDHAELRAPFDGVVAFTNIRKGDLVSGAQFDSTNAKTATRTASMVIIDPTAFEVVVNLPVFVAAKVKKGQKAYIADQETLAELQLGRKKLADQAVFEKFIAASVVSVSPAVNPEDRSIRVRLETADDDKSARLIDGGFVFVWIETVVKKNAVALPLEAVGYRSGEAFTYVVDEQGSARRRTLRLGVIAAEGMEVLEGIKAGDIVIGKGRSIVRDGTPVVAAPTREATREATSK
ncbi:MAG: RND family efflux transporter MFP subunit [Verrucomicrobiales bacterium]|jgi:RND family efflux transporter MFP subunit